MKGNHIMSGAKKILSAVLCAVMLVGMTACGGNGETASAETTAAETATAETSTAEATTTAEVTTTTEATTTAEITTTADTAGEDETMPEESEEKKLIALTFDDGPNTTTTNEVLDVLEKYGVKGSFFLIGNNITEESAESVKRAYEMGCDIGNHSKSHPFMTDLSDEEILEEIKFTNDKIYDIIGEYPKYFRPPYIAVNNKMFDLIDETFINGFGVTDYDDRVTAEIRYKRVMRQAKDGAIILLHDAAGNSQTVEALDMMIPDLISQGYELVTLTELFERKGITLGDEKILYSYADQTSMYG